jgi:NAD(P)-dependent dehydrogenase (short-subunit alcohol dehydrogenase family)
VFITGRRQSELEVAVSQIGQNVTAVQSDVSKIADLDKLYAAVKERKGELDIVFANAGSGAFAPLGQISEEHFDKQFDVNVRGLLFTVQKALPLMPPGGSIVLNASIVSTTGSPAFSVYSATKAAVRSFARTWSVDLKERKIRVNAISPGIIPTPAYNTSLGMTQEQVNQFVQSSIGNIPLGRPALRMKSRRPCCSWPPTTPVRNRHRVVRRWGLGSGITERMPGIGECDAEKRRTPVSTIWETCIA